MKEEIINLSEEIQENIDKLIIKTQIYIKNLGKTIWIDPKSSSHQLFGYRKIWYDPKLFAVLIEQDGEGIVRLDEIGYEELSYILRDAIL